MKKGEKKRTSGRWLCSCDRVYDHRNDLLNCMDKHEMEKDETYRRNTATKSN